MNKQSKIYLAQATKDGKLVSFTGKDEKQYAKLWLINRVVFGRAGIHASFARINGDEKVLDGTVPEFVEDIPRDAIEVPQGVAELLHKANSHYFGNISLTEDEMEDFLTSEGINIMDSEDVPDSTIVFNKAVDYGFESVELKENEGIYKFNY